MKESHHIDTSVILGSFSENEEWYYECKGYLGKSGYKYRPRISVFVLGEIFMIVEDRFVEVYDRELFFRFFDRMVSRSGLLFDSFTPRVLEIFGRIVEVDYSVEPMDALNLAIMIDSGSRVFVTLDQRLIGNRNLERSFKIRVLHPKDL